MDNFDLESFRQTVPVGSKWRHRNGAEYVVLLLANTSYLSPLYPPNLSPLYPPTVVYKGSNEHVWARVWDNWFETMTRIDLPENTDR